MVRIEKPSTVYISFPSELPGRFDVVSKSGELYHFRYLNRRTPRIKFNIPTPGTYYFSCPAIVTKVVDIELPDNLPELPEYERSRVKDVVIEFEPSLSGTPARIYTDLTEIGLDYAVIQKGVDFYDFPPVMRVFFLLHELGHLYYKTEWKCDLFALIHYLKMGYNRSVAMYCLTHVLRETDGNIERVNKLFENIKKTQ